MSQLEDDKAKAEVEFDADAEFAKAVDEMAGQGSDLPDADLDKAIEPDKADEQGQDDDPPAKADASEKEPEGKDTDIWADAPPALKAAYEAEQARAARLEATAQSHARSASQLGRSLAELEAKLPKGKAAPAGESDEDREARYTKLREEYPDSVAPLLDDIATIRAELAEVRGAAAGIQQERTEADAIAQYTILDGRHPNWRQDVVSQNYVDWAQSQPAPVLEAIQRNAQQLSDGATAAWVLDQWKRDTAPPANPGAEKLAERRAEQREASRSADVRNPATVAKEEPTDAEGLWKAEMARRDRKK